MRWTTLPAVGAVLTAAGLALAHEGVTNPAVLERMDSMSALQDNTKVLGEMAKGERPFDVAEARAAAEAIARHAAETPVLFAARETDPMSEARPRIWEEFDDFEARALELEQAARAAAGIKSRADLGPALAGIGRACKACHEPYRE